MEDLETKVNVFESIKHIDENGNEYWYARELMKALEYGEWRKFMPAINKAKNACEKSNQKADNHFVHLDEMINIAKGAKRKILDYNLSRYACYLIVQNADSREKVIALAQTYFAVQTIICFLKMKKEFIKEI